MLVDGARSDLASPRERHLGASMSGEEGAEHHHACAHLFHELVGSLGPDVVSRAHPHAGGGVVHLASEEAQERRSRVDVAQLRHVAQQALAL